MVAPRNRRHQCHVFKLLEARKSEQSSTRQIPLLILHLFRFFPFLLGADIRREDAWVPAGSPTASATSPDARGKRYPGSSAFHVELHLHPGICQPLQQLLQIRGKDDTKRYAVPAGSRQAAKAALRWAKTFMPCSELENFFVNLRRSFSALLCILPQITPSVISITRACRLSSVS